MKVIFLSAFFWAKSYISRNNIVLLIYQLDYSLYFDANTAGLLLQCKFSINIYYCS